MTYNELLYYLLPFLTGGVCMSVYYLIWGREPEADLSRSSDGGRKIERKGVFLLLFGPLIVVLGQLISTLPMEREKLKKRLVQAGSPGGLNVDEFHAARIVAIVILAFAGLFLDNELDMSPMMTVGFIALGFVYPDIWLSGKILKRRQRIFRDLPDVLDTLRLAVDAGLDLSSAMKVVVDQGRKGPLIEEFDRVERDISLGLTRQDAFRRFAERIQMQEINSFVLALIQADQLGASIGPVLKVQGEVSRGRRWQLAEVLVNKLPMKMMGPLVVFIFPASFIILFTPLIIQWLES